MWASCKYKCECYVWRNVCAEIDSTLAQGCTKHNANTANKDSFDDAQEQ